MDILRIETMDEWNEKQPIQTIQSEINLSWFSARKMSDQKKKR